MNRQFTIHHSLPRHLEGFANLCRRATISLYRHRLLSFLRLKRTARQLFVAMTDRNNVSVKRLRIPFCQLAEDQYPVLYFTRMNQHPVMIRERAGDRYVIQLWDGREALSSEKILFKTLQESGFVMGENGQVSRRRLIKSGKGIAKGIHENRRHFLLGIGNGVISCSILVLLLFLMHRSFESTFHSPDLNSFGLSVLGILASILAVTGFFQARSFVGAYFKTLSASLKAREVKFPSVFAIQKVSDVRTGREIIELAAVPFLLATAALIVGYNPFSVATWGTVVGCLVPAFVFSTKLFGFITRVRQASLEVNYEVIDLDELPALSRSSKRPRAARPRTARSN